MWNMVEHGTSESFVGPPEICGSPSAPEPNQQRTNLRESSSKALKEKKRKKVYFIICQRRNEKIDNLNFKN